MPVKEFTKTVNCLVTGKIRPRIALYRPQRDRRDVRYACFGNAIGMATLMTGLSPDCVKTMVYFCREKLIYLTN